MPVSTAALLGDQHGGAPPVPDEKKAIFFATAELGV
jgi:hypothetical protein